MSLDPPVQRAAGGLGFAPVPFEGEWFGIARPAVELQLDGLGPRLRLHGTVYLSNLRAVFVEDAERSPRAVDLPLAYMEGVAFHQPILGCNNLAGKCWSVEGGFRQGSPLSWKISLRRGGAGTFLPVFFRYREEAEQAARAAEAEAAAAQGGESAGEGAGPRGPRAPTAPALPPDFLRAALVDPNDPTVLYVAAQPLGEGAGVRAGGATTGKGATT